MMRTFAHLYTRYEFTFISRRTGRAFYRVTNRRSEAAMILDTLKAVEGELEHTLKITRTIRYRELYVCHACLKRPAKWEMDCDGSFPTVDCGICDWDTLYSAREGNK